MTHLKARVTQESSPGSPGKDLTDEPSQPCCCQAYLHAYRTYSLTPDPTIAHSYDASALNLTGAGDLIESKSGYSC